MNQRLIRWLEGKISEGLESLGKEADQRAVDWVIGAKNSLLATLVTLSNVSIALEKSPVCDEPNVTEAQDVPFSEADVTLVRSFLSKHSNA